MMLLYDPWGSCMDRIAMRMIWMTRKRICSETSKKRLYPHFGHNQTARFPMNRWTVKAVRFFMCCIRRMERALLLMDSLPAAVRDQMAAHIPSEYSAASAIRRQGRHHNDRWGKGEEQNSSTLRYPFAAQHAQHGLREYHRIEHTCWPTYHENGNSSLSYSQHSLSA